MIKNKFLMTQFLLALICLILVSCKYDIHHAFFRGPVTDNRAANLKDVTAPSIQGRGKVNFAIITDFHLGGKKTRAEAEVIKDLKNKPIDFIVLLGDVVESGFDSYFNQCEDFIARLKAVLGRQDLPIYVVLGNHDIYYNGLDRWKKLNFSWNQGESFFRFQTSVVDDSGKTHLRSWYFLDTASGIVGTKQMESLISKIKSDNNPKIVFTHYPIYVDTEFAVAFKLSDPRERSSLISLFDKNKVDMVFSGHWHVGGFFDYGRLYELCCSSFVENSKGESSWFVLSLDEVTKKISIEHLTVESGNTTSRAQVYSLGR